MASIDAAPPIRFIVLVMREARVLVLKLPLSSTSAGQCLSITSPNSLGHLRRAIGRHAALGEQLLEQFFQLRQTQAKFEVRREVAAELGANHHGQPLAIERLFVVARVDQCLVGRFQQHELQRVGLLHLLGRYFVFPPVVGKVGDVAAQGRRRAIVRRLPGS